MRSLLPRSAMHKLVVDDLQKLADASKAKVLQGFFKTGKGEYGEGDVFLGITVPQQRSVAKTHFQSFSSPKEFLPLLQSGVHEHRTTACLMLIEKFEEAAKLKSKGEKAGKRETDGEQTDEPARKKRRKSSANDSNTENTAEEAFGTKEIYDFVMSNTKHINNWDLVDLTAPKICGPYLFERPTAERSAVLLRLAKSDLLWDRRISVVSTQHFIRQKYFDDTLSLAGVLLNDPHDLIHKAVGWMLREVGKKNQTLLEKFLQQHAHEMPRTMLRYSIERLPDAKRKKFLNQQKK